jgi:hypothetical protein
MAQFILCPRSNRRITDAECADNICRLNDPAEVFLCRTCGHGKSIAATAKFLRKPKHERNIPMPKTTKPTGKKRNMDRITISVPTEIKAKLKAFSKGEMGNMSAQGRYYLLRALEMAEDRAERARERTQ